MSTAPPTDPSGPSTLASRKADRAARLAAGEVEPEPRAFGLRAGFESSTPNLVVTRVTA